MRAVFPLLFLGSSVGNLNENDLQGLMYLHGWFPVGGTVWKGLGPS